MIESKRLVSTKKLNISYLMFCAIVFLFSSKVMSNNKDLKSMYKLSDFKETPIGSLSENDLRKLNYSTHEFKVEFKDGELLINKASNNILSELDIDGGKLQGIDKGEWGGELLFQPNSSKADKIKIKDGNIVSIFRFKDQIYFLEGLAHMDINEGTLYRLNVANNTFSYDQLFDFKDAPMAISNFDDQIFVVSFGSLYVISNGNKEPLFEDTFWKFLYPNSITCIDRDTLYIGIRGGIVKVNIRTRKMSFYRFKDQ